MRFQSQPQRLYMHKKLKHVKIHSVFEDEGVFRIPAVLKVGTYVLHIAAIYAPILNSSWQDWSMYIKHKAVSYFCYICSAYSVL